MSRAAYLDCFSGVSGNMLLGALLDCGLDEHFLRETLASLNLSGFQLRIESVNIQGLQAKQVRVLCETQHHHRHLNDIKAILAKSTLTAPIQQRIGAVFTRLAIAEAVVHGTTMDKVHFHEVGALDAIVDITGVIAGFDALAVDTITCSPLPMGTGWVQCEHGAIPLPAPAVCHLLKGVPVYGETLAQELVTPTGAALVAELADTFGPMPTMTLIDSGFGAGTMERKDARPNLLRLVLGKAHQVTEAQEVEVIETHLDDWNPEFWPALSEKILQTGALDISLTPMQMKKGRPGYLLRIICDPAHSDKLKTLIFSDTSSIGLRFHRQQRATLAREQVKVKTPWGMVQAKKVLRPQGPVTVPEYEACKKIADHHQIPLQTVYATINQSERN